jgi:hypothetical protein
VPTYTPPFIEAGEATTAAQLTSRLDDVAASTTGITRAQLDDEARFDCTMFAEDAAPHAWCVHALTYRGEAMSASVTWTFTARIAGQFMNATGYNNSTGATITPTVYKDGVAMANDTAIEPGDVITTIIAAGATASVVFHWRHARAP